jgi:MFS family permease
VGKLKQKQIVALFVYNFSIWTLGIGLLPLLPLYAEKLGADPSIIGYYLAFANLALAAGAITAGWLSDRFQRRKLPMMIVGSAAIPAVWLMGLATNMLGLTLLTMFIWFCAGIGLALANILAGLSAGKTERGKIFGILSLTNGLGTLVGSLTTGYLVDHWGYAAMFLVMAAFCILWPGPAFFLTDKEALPVQEKSGPVTTPGLGRAFYFLFAAAMIASIAGFIVSLVRSLLMNDLGFGATAIGSTGAIGAIVTLPIPLLIGWLSDRRGRKAFMYFGYGISAVSVMVLAFSSMLWHFWLFALLQSLSSALTGPVANALATDILPPKALGKGLGLFGASGWIGGILGSALGGLALKSFGLAPTLGIAISMSLSAVLLLTLIHPRVQAVQPDPNPGVADAREAAEG